MLALLDFRVRQRDFLLEIARAITARLDLSEVLRRVLHASTVMLAGQVGVIALRDASGEYRVRALLGVDPARLPEINTRLRALIEAASSEMDYTELDTRLRELAEWIDSKLVQAFALPLNMAGESNGLLIVFRATRTSATPDDIQVLQSFADQAAIAVHNAQLYAHVDHERRRLNAIVQHSADGVLLLDASLRILSINRALEKMTAWRAADAVGQPLDAVLQWTRIDQGEGALERAIARHWHDGSREHAIVPAVSEGTASSVYTEPTPNGETAPAESEPVVYMEGDIVRHDGITLSIGVSFSPLFNPDGRLATVIANVRDITNFRRAQEMQNVFISTISHELKTPVALIKGHAATLRRDDVEFPAAFVRDYAAVIEEEADRLTAQIENLLTASRVAAERTMRLSIGDVDLRALAERAVERFSTQTSLHTLRLAFVDDFPRTVPGDETRLRQVLDNLLNNAIKYSPEGGEIVVSGEVHPEAVSIAVRDHGVGMTEAEQERAFDRFYRVDSALSRRTQGTGLGLYLAKAIVEAHNGSIRVHSAPHQGSTFTFTLPLTR
jgi:PAS domain S-box-containing protein